MPIADEGSIPMPNTGEDGDDNQALKKQQYELLGRIQILNLTANPPIVKPFGNTMLSWDVRVPTTLHAPVALRLGGKNDSGAFRQRELHGPLNNN